MKPAHKSLRQSLLRPRDPALGMAALGKLAGAEPLELIETRAECLEQILSAFCDIIDLDDIHQAAARLTRVQDWIRREAESAGADPILAEDSPSTAAALPHDPPSPACAG